MGEGGRTAIRTARAVPGYLQRVRYWRLTAGFASSAAYTALDKRTSPSVGGATVKLTMGFRFRAPWAPPA